MRRFLHFVSFLTSDFKKPTCFAFIFAFFVCIVRNILETFVKIRISSYKASRWLFFSNQMSEFLTQKWKKTGWVINPVILKVWKFRKQNSPLWIKRLLIGSLKNWKLNFDPARRNETFYVMVYCSQSHCNTFINM